MLNVVHWPIRILTSSTQFHLRDQDQVQCCMHCTWNRVWYLL